MCSIFLLFFLLNFVYCESSLDNVNITNELLKYEKYIKQSQDLDKSDRSLLSSWSCDVQVMMVNLTTRYRLDMMRHKEHNFQQIGASRWLECLSLQSKEISKSEREYYASEAECLKVASVADHTERRAVHQFGREIKKWRKSYRYLANQCHQNNPGNTDAVSVCLVQLVKRDSYDVTFQRLINLKHQSMAAVYVKMSFATFELEKCLKSTLSEYITTVRNISHSLNKCYNKTFNTKTSQL